VHENAHTGLKETDDISATSDIARNQFYKFCSECVINILHKINYLVNSDFLTSNKFQTFPECV